MNSAPNLAEPEPRRKPQGEETTRKFWKPPVLEAAQPRVRPAVPPPAPYLLAPRPWPRGQFRIDPEG